VALWRRNFASEHERALTDAARLGHPAQRQQITLEIKQHAAVDRDWASLARRSGDVIMKRPPPPVAETSWHQLGSHH
jgi:hypothetical protein